MKEFAAKVLGIKEEIPIPDNCEVWDDKGNVINTSKIIIREKKKEYPKTYEECLSVLGIYNGLPDVEIYNAKPSECKLFESLIRLKRCRDAYWKIAGEEMELGKDLFWIPDWMCLDPLYVILYQYHDIYKTEVNGGTSCILAFPTEEMRDAFYENFKELIESCKELL